MYRSPKPTATHIFHPQQIQEMISHSIKQTPQNGTLGLTFGTPKWQYLIQKVSVLTLFWLQEFSIIVILTYIQGTPKRKDIRTLKIIALHPYPIMEEYKYNFQSYSKHTLLENMGYGRYPGFEKIIKS